MNFAKNILRMAVAAMVAMAVTACSEPDEGTGVVPSDMTLNTAWRVEYIGKECPRPDYNCAVRVSCDDTLPYIVTLVEASQYDPMHLTELCERLLADIRLMVDELNATNGASYTVADFLLATTNEEYFSVRPGRYVALALGVTPEGEPSGYYAASHPFDAVNATPTADYSAWLGEWDVVGKNNATTRIRVESDWVNRTVIIRGWEGFDYPIVVEYSTDRNDLIIPTQCVARNVEFSLGTGDVYLFAADDKYYYDDSKGNFNIALAGVLDDGSRAIVRYAMPGFPIFEQMFFMAKIGDKFYALTDEDKIPCFPAMIVPATGTASQRTTSPLRLIPLARPLSPLAR